jgi:hypothetical protein
MWFLCFSCRLDFADVLATGAEEKIYLFSAYPNPFDNEFY